MLFDFIKNHYELIISIILVLFSLVLTLVKKKPVLNKVDEIKSRLLEILPSFIESVEIPGNGSKKKQLVLNLVKLWLAKEYSYFNFDDIVVYVSECIENILAAPSKSKQEGE